MNTAAARKRPTIRDVAQLCGVSKSTVSVILNDSPASSRVPRDTQDRVRQAASQIGYRPSWQARALTSRRTHTIGVLYAPPMPLIVRGNYEGIMAGIHETLARHGYHMMFVPLGEDPATWGDLLMDQRMDGCLILSRLHDSLAGLLRETRMPAALVNADTTLPLPVCVADEFDGGVQITRHLIDLGHERITFFLGEQPSHYSVTERVGGYEHAMTCSGLGRHIDVVRGTLQNFIDATIARPADDRPTAMICYTHFLAITTLRLLWERGHRVPQDLSVATFSNSYPVAEVIPPLTTVGLPTEEMGRAAAQMVIDQIQSGGEAEPRRVVLKETLIVRKSTAARQV
jgi:LacI family transcriptional regulator, galactose operon repressor